MIIQIDNRYTIVFCGSTNHLTYSLWKFYIFKINWTLIEMQHYAAYSIKKSRIMYHKRKGITIITKRMYCVDLKINNFAWLLWMRCMSVFCFTFFTLNLTQSWILQLHSGNGITVSIILYRSQGEFLTRRSRWQCNVVCLHIVFTLRYILFCSHTQKKAFRVQRLHLWWLSTCQHLKEIYQSHIKHMANLSALAVLFIFVK